MRIITGNFKGKKILDPKDKVTRPLKDLTKESIFNIILHSKKFKVLLKNSNVFGNLPYNISSQILVKFLSNFVQQ